MKLRMTLVGLSWGLFFPLALQAQGKLDDYKRAESILPWNVNKLVFSLQVDATWIADSEMFWYRNDTRAGKEFVLVDVANRVRKPAFDHAKLASCLSRQKGKKYQAKELPLRSFKFVRDAKAIEFDLDEEAWVCDLGSYECSKTTRIVPGYHERLSPDGKWIAFVDDFNVFVRSTSTGKVIRLSRDGWANYDYARRYDLPDFVTRKNHRPRKPYISVIWSPDSKKLFTYRVDRRKAGKTHLIQSAPPGDRMRAIVYSHVYPLPGESDIPLAELVVFDLEKRKQISIKWKPLLHPLRSWRLPQGYWSKDSRRVYFLQRTRGYKTAALIEADSRTGRARKIIEERSSSLVDHNTQLLYPVDNGAEIIWSSERDGWNHLYLYDGKTGRKKRRITKGAWVVRGIEHVDEKNRQVYFTAGGKEKGRDPYLRHLYKINLDGTGLQLLTPEDADHQVDFSPSGDFFIDSYSRINTAPVSVLRRSTDGQVVMKLEKADLDLLLAKGWRWPEPFKAKARDGKTDVYGVLFRPSSFDPSKKYPVIEDIYSGPHGYYAPKNFPRNMRNIRKVFISQSMAEVGFMVVAMDGMGQNHRGRDFRDVQYKNLADSGLKDRIGAIRQLAERYAYLDVTRVGIFGFSAGGYASTRAVLDHPEFYKVAVSAAGNHDHRMDKLSWNERWMGYPVGEHYHKQSNITDAHKLKGKLLLAYGDLDTNVPPASTVRMVHALMEANKDFDLLVFPNRGHYLDSDPYFIRKRWDYFVEHLLGTKPPREYKIRKPF